MGGAPAELLVGALPPSVTELSLFYFQRVRDAWDADRPQIRSALSCIPLLRTLEIAQSFVTPILRGLLDAGVDALPNLTAVNIRDIIIPHESVEDFSMCGYPHLRRFLRRFRNCAVSLEVILKTHSDWDCNSDLSAEHIVRYQRWPRVTLIPSPPELQAFLSITKSSTVLFHEDAQFAEEEEDHDDHHGAHVIHHVMYPPPNLEAATVPGEEEDELEAAQA